MFYGDRLGEGLREPLEIIWIEFTTPMTYFSPTEKKC